MIGYVTLGASDLSRAIEFYDALLGELGAVRAFTTKRMVAWRGPDGGALLSVVLPYDGQPASVGNGVMVALAVASQDDVDRIYKRAMELGGADEGPPGKRGVSFYGAYFRDLDGNKLNVHCW